MIPGSLSTLVVAATVVALGAVLPLTDAYVTDVPDDPSGHSVVRVRYPSDGSVDMSLTVSLVPAQGWRPIGTDGATPEAASLVSERAVLAVRLVPAASVADCSRVRVEAEGALRAEADVAPRAPAVARTTAQGVAGTVTPFGSGLTEGLVFVACHGGMAVVLSASGPIGALPGALDGVGEMIGSVRFR